MKNGIVGFEPTNDRTKIDCLTIWLYSTISASFNGNKKIFIIKFVSIVKSDLNVLIR